MDGCVGGDVGAKQAPPPPPSPRHHLAPHVDVNAAALGAPPGRAVPPAVAYTAGAGGCPVHELTMAACDAGAVDAGGVPLYDVNSTVGLATAPPSELLTSDAAAPPCDDDVNETGSCGAPGDGTPRGLAVLADSGTAPVRKLVVRLAAGDAADDVPTSRRSTNTAEMLSRLPAASADVTKSSAAFVNARLAGVPAGAVGSMEGACVLMVAASCAGSITSHTPSHASTKKGGGGGGMGALAVCGALAADSRPFGRAHARGSSSQARTTPAASEVWGCETMDAVALRNGTPSPQAAHHLLLGREGGMRLEAKVAQRARHGQVPVDAADDDRPTGLFDAVRLDGVGRLVIHRLERHHAAAGRASDQRRP